MKTFDIRKILVPTDFSETAGNALEQAITLAKASNAKIKLLYVISPEYITSWKLLIPAAETFYDKVKKYANAELKKITESLKTSSDLNVEFIIKSGVIGETICTVAKKEKFDLIVMGTHGMSGVKEFFSGSNAYRVVNNSVCPVLTVQKKPIKKSFKNIILPVRLERSSRQKVDYVVELAQLFDSTVFITGFTSEKDESKQYKVKQYVTQVEGYLTKLNIKHKSKSIFAKNFVKEILAHAKKNNADLIAVMKDHDFSINQLIRGPYAEQFVNHSSIPILSVPVFSNSEVSYTPYLSGSAPY